MKETTDSAANAHEEVRAYRRVREQEILRVAAEFSGDDSTEAIVAARNEVLRWSQNKAVGSFPDEAWEFKSFERLSGGRSCSAVFLKTDDQETWALRIEDPDKTVAGRVWTTEVNISSHVSEQNPQFTLRLSASTPESFLAIEPHVPGVVKQVIKSPGLWAGNYKLTDRPLRINSDDAGNKLCNALLDTSRKLPIIALSVPDDFAQTGKPLLDAEKLAAACAGLAIVTILSPKISWMLTDRFGKQLSVYGGAARVYLPGFTEDSNPFGGHELLLAQSFDRPGGLTQALTRLRWIAANGSVRRLQLGKDLQAFASVKALQFRQRQIALQNTGATDREQLLAANEQIELLERELQESRNYEQQFSNLHQEAELRSETAEAQLRASAFRIQQLLDQLKASGVLPDAKISLPSEWDEFANWCEVNLAGRVVLSPQARRSVKDAEFNDPKLSASCLLWLGNEYRDAKMNGGEGSLRDANVTTGVLNAHCGSDAFQVEWQGRSRDVDWHVKNGGNTRDPSRCLRIYYFWDEGTQQVVVALMPSHRRTDAS